MFLAMVFIGAWGTVVLLAMASVFSYFVFAGKSFVSRKCFFLSITALLAVLFSVGKDLSVTAAAIIIIGVLAGATALAWQKNKEWLVPKVKLAITAIFGLVVFGTFCSYLSIIIWLLITGARGKNRCFGLFCAICIIISLALVGILAFWYKYYFLPAWRNFRSRPTGS